MVVLLFALHSPIKVTTRICNGDYEGHIYHYLSRVGYFLFSCNVKKLF